MIIVDFVQRERAVVGAVGGARDTDSLTVAKTMPWKGNDSVTVLFGGGRKWLPQPCCRNAVQRIVVAAGDRADGVGAADQISGRVIGPAHFRRRTGIRGVWVRL